MKKIFKNIRL